MELKDKYKNSPPKTVVVMQLRQLGDILLTTPVIRAIKDFWPECRLVFVGHKMSKLVLSDNPYIDDFVLYAEGDSVISYVKMIRKLRGFNADLLIDFMNNPRSAFLSRVSGAKYKVSYSTKRKFLYDQTFVVDDKSAYISSTKLRLLENVGVVFSDIRLDFVFAPIDTQVFRSFSEKHLPKDSEVSAKVVISATHRRENRRWPVERYAKISDHLVEHWQAEVIWVWGPGEKEFVEHGVSLCQKKAHLGPQTNFKELGAFFKNCDLFIGNSNGPSHVAVAAGICSLQLHGHTNALSWCPKGNKHHYLQSSDYGKQGATLGPISVDMVKAKLSDMKTHVYEYRNKKSKLLESQRDSGVEAGVIEDWRLHVEI